MDMQRQAINIVSSAIVGLGVGVAMGVAPAAALGLGASSYLVNVCAFQALHNLKEAPVDDEVPEFVRYTGNASIILAWAYTASKIMQYVSFAVFSAPISLPSAFILSATSMFVGVLYIATAIRENEYGLG